MAEPPAIERGTQSLGASARASIMWGGGFTLLRDVAQFIAMLVLMRVVGPEQYGAAALAQSVVGAASVLSFQTFSLHALQLRDPTRVDWQAHFSAAVVLNTAAIALVLLLAWGLSSVDAYRDAALPLAALSAVFLVEVPATLRHRQLETAHAWSRYRVLLIAGTILGLSVGLLVGIAGGGVWALVVQPPLFGLPAAIDLFVGGRFRPDWTWNWARYRDTIWFGLNRGAAMGLARGRLALENMVLAAIFSFATLGLFTRAIGLASILVGRLGSIAVLSLYPILTRAQPTSDHFRRLACLVLSGVCWVSFPIAGYTAIVADELVWSLYGATWLSVAPLLPLAAASIGLSAITTVVTNLMLANDNQRLALQLELLVQLSSAMLLVLAPFGLVVYLSALVLQAACVLAIASTMLVCTKGITLDGVRMAFLPPALATALAVAVTLAALGQMGAVMLLVRLLVAGFVLAAVFVGVLLIVFRDDLRKLLAVVPGGGAIARLMLLTPA